MIIINRCPLCGSEKLREFYKGIDGYYSGKQTICSACDNCGLIFLNPRPTDEECKEWYKSVFQDKRRGLTTVEQVVSGIERKKKYEKKKRLLRFFKGYIDKNSKCLDIGAGWGTLAKVIEDKFSCSVDIVEPSKLAAKVAKEYFSLNSYNEGFNSFADRERGRKIYKFIYAFHVFEHIAEPDIFLKNTRELLDKDGILFLALPDTLNPEQPSERLFHIDHCFYYTPRTIELLLNKYDYRVISLLRCKKDMKVVCAPESKTDNQAAGKNNIFNKPGFSRLARKELKKAARNIKNLDRKYSAIRFIRKIIYTPLNVQQRAKINTLIYNLRRGYFR